MGFSQMDRSVEREEMDIGIMTAYSLSDNSSVCMVV